MSDSRALPWSAFAPPALVALAALLVGACEMPHGEAIQTSQNPPGSGGPDASLLTGRPSLEGVHVDAGARDAARDAPVADGHADASDAGDAAPNPATLWEGPGLPRFDDLTVAHVRDLLTRGEAQGRRQTAVAKIGDALTASPAFLVDAGQFGCVFGDFEALNGLTLAASLTIFGDGSNSFTRISPAAVPTWTVADALASPNVASELDFTRATVALVMLGTNDLAFTDPAAFGRSLDSLVDSIESVSVVPVLSTIPRRIDTPASAQAVALLNAQIRQVAARRHLPLVDLFAITDPLGGNGLAQDGVTLSVEQTSGGPLSCDFSPAGLAFGFDQRNLLTLQVLDRVWRLD